jgi:hypothetical protein
VGPTLQHPATRTAFIERFTKTQRDKRKWINFAEMAEHCSEENGVVPNEVAREAAYKKLLADFIEDYFEENGRSQIMYLHPNTAKARMTRKWMTHVRELYDHQTIISQYLAHCWMPRVFSERWFAKHRMDPHPQRFEPKRQTPLRQHSHPHHPVSKLPKRAGRAFRRKRRGVRQKSRFLRQWLRRSQ